MGKKVLIIDDDPALLAQMGEAFRKNNFDVFLARDGQAGIEMFESIQPDLVITDIVMPAKEGVSVIIDIKKSGSDVLLIAMSGGGARGCKNYLRWAKELGANVAIEKPFRMSTFLMIAKQLISEADYMKHDQSGDHFSLTYVNSKLSSVSEDMNISNSYDHQHFTK